MSSLRFDKTDNPRRRSPKGATCRINPSRGSQTSLTSLPFATSLFASSPQRLQPIPDDKSLPSFTPSVVDYDIRTARPAAYRPSRSLT